MMPLYEASFVKRGMFSLHGPSNTMIQQHMVARAGWAFLSTSRRGGWPWCVDLSSRLTVRLIDFFDTDPPKKNVDQVE